MKANLSTDHRVADGAEAAQFLVEIKRLLENPISLEYNSFGYQLFEPEDYLIRGFPFADCPKQGD
ncbi:MAG: hypothetical protein Ct9H300mP11_10560 [Chloroflexota bacterium]|nr:MAG: hypothetical protein Ct9H300mP11_10560 [Chloroflexota bacterium]